MGYEGIEVEVTPGPGPTETPPSLSSLLWSRTIRALEARGVILVLSFTLSIVVARTLSPAGRGHFALLQALNGLTAVTVNFAVSSAALYHIGKGSLSPERAGGAASALAALSGALGAMVLIPIALLLKGSIFAGIPTLFVVGAILLATPLLLRDYLGGVMVAMRRPVAFLVSHAAQPFGALSLLTAALVLGVPSLGAVVLAWTVGILLSGVTVVATLLVLLKGRPQARRADVRSVGRFGLRTYPSLLATFLNLRLDQFLVRILASAAVLGQYAVAVNVGELLFQIPAMILLGWSGAISSAKEDESGALVVQSCRGALVLLTTAALVVALAAPLGIPFVFGPQYRPAVDAVLLLLPGMICYAPAAVIMQYFVVQRAQPKLAAVIPLVSLVVSSILNIPLTPALGAAGASLASTISYAAMLAVATLLFTRAARRSLFAIFAVSKDDVREVTRSILHLSSMKEPEPRSASQ